MLRYLLYILLLVGLGCGPALAAGRLHGDALLSYGSFTAEEDGEKVVDAHHFVQQYSLLYGLEGKIKEGRGGTYDLALGYEWNSIAGEVVNRSRGIDEDLDITTGKILYRGELKFEPGGLPFRFHAYSRDMHRSTLIEDSMLPAGADIGTVRTESVLSPHIVDDIQNGQHIQTGATLLVGIRNGSYLGRYRDVLSRFPRLLVDYREVRVRDMESSTPQNYRSRDLAFVSLNKKDNWFHYRFNDYKDHLNRREDRSRKQVMLGTVDHNLMRQWINLTNWIRVSADGSYTETDYAFDPQRDEERYDLNLFARAERLTWESSTFASYQRTREPDLLEKELEVPVFAEGELSRDTSWRAQLIHYSEDSERSRGLVPTWQEDNLYGAIRFETFRRAPVILAPKVEAEVKGGDKGEGQAMRLGAEVFSNSAFSPRVSWLGGLQLGLFDGEGVWGQDVSYWETVANGKVRVFVTDSLQVGAEERVVYGDGDLVQGITEHIAPYGEQSLLASNAEFQSRSGTTVRSTSSVFLEHDYRRRILNRLEVIYDVLDADDKTTSQVIARHRLHWSERAWYLDASTEYVTGDDVETRNVSSVLLQEGATGTVGDARIVHTSRFDYRPNRMFETGGRFDYDWRSRASEGDDIHLRAAQDARYSFYTVNGIVRKIAELNEELAYERFEGDAETRSALTLAFGGNYYPTHYLWFGASVRYRLFASEDQDEMAYYLLAGLTFEKFQVTADYAYGDRSEGDDGYAGRIEHRWHVNVRKIF